MFNDDNTSLYGYALLLTGVIVVSSMYIEKPRIPVASLTHSGEDRLVGDLSGGEYETASIPSTEDGFGDEDDAAASAWDYPGIRWRSYSDGLAEMQRTGKDGVLIIQADDCVPCQSYSRQFYTEDVLAMAENYVFILTDARDEPTIEEFYNIDGDYLPRTFLISPEGRLRRTQTAADDSRRFFVNPYDSGELVGLLRTAL